MALAGILFIVAAFCAIVALMSYHVRRLSMYREAAKFTGPPVLPIIGNALHFVGNTHDLLKKALRLMETYPSPVKIWLADRLYFFVCDVEVIKTILNSSKSLEKDSAYKFTRPYVGTGLFSAPADKWRVHRKLIQPTMNPRLQDSDMFVGTFAKHSGIVRDLMSVEVNKGEFGIFDYISRCTFDVICETTMGVCLNVQTDKDNKYFYSTTRGAEIAYMRMFLIWLQPDFLFNLTTVGKEFNGLMKYLHSVTDEIIQRKMSAHENDNQVENEPDEYERSTTKKAFLDLLLDLSKDGTKLTNEELRDEVNTMLIAGSETNGTAVAYALLMLANYSEIQDKVYQELCDIYGDEVSSDAPVQKDDLRRMEYMERVLKETLRLFPAGPLVARAITDDITIGDRTMPKGSSAVLGLMQLHRCEKYWTDPLKFDPDRFLPEEVAKRHPYSYVPFSGGPRGCLGPIYAMASMKAILTTLLRRYIFKKDKVFKVEDLQFKATLVLKPAETLTLRIIERPKFQSKR